MWCKPQLEGLHYITRVCKFVWLFVSLFLVWLARRLAGCEFVCVWNLPLLFPAFTAIRVIRSFWVCSSLGQAIYCHWPRELRFVWRMRQAIQSNRFNFHPQIVNLLQESISVSLIELSRWRQSVKILGWVLGFFWLLTTELSRKVSSTVLSSIVWGLNVCFIAFVRQYATKSSDVTRYNWCSNWLAILSVQLWLTQANSCHQLTESA